MATPKKNGNGVGESIVDSLETSMRKRMSDITNEARGLASRLEALNTEHQRLSDALNALSGEAKAKR